MEQEKTDQISFVKDKYLLKVQLLDNNLFSTCALL